MYITNQHNIGLIDADLLDSGGTNHPNLALMKISNYFKQLHRCVTLLLSYNNINKYDYLYMSKVFSQTRVPTHLLQYPYNLTYGGTGFSYNNASTLPAVIEHCMPDYSLYDKYIKSKLHNKTFNVDNYTKFSIGFTTRGCIRGCAFCVNQHSKEVIRASKVSEFHDVTKPYIRLWDDNILAAPKYIFDEVIADIRSLNKKVVWQQGLDIRLMNDYKADVLTTLNYYKRNYIFAFDDIKDSQQIENGLKCWIKYMYQNTKVRSMYGKAYVLVGYKSLDIHDIIEMFQRIEILFKYGIVPMPMFYNGTENIKKSEFYWLYQLVKNWTNPLSIGKQSLLQYAQKHRIKLLDKINALLKTHNDLLYYFNMIFNNLKQY